MDSGYLLQCAACGHEHRVAHGRTGQAVRCGACGAPLIRGNCLPDDVTDADWEREVLGSRAPVIVVVWGPECPVCADYEVSVGQMAIRLYGEARVLRLNIEENPETARRYGIEGVPMVLLFRDGRLLAQLPGPRGEQGLREALGLGEGH
ncbi:thioredoxin family protein [Deferrisoma camini]|uniref:thioredoxin family protein n=1 Tax=Deferrisoma camini TaxID=1035120 RepID=UPI00046CC996|nr:thioredoxin family protein [Deferrisoma camini]